MSKAYLQGGSQAAAAERSRASIWVAQGQRGQQANQLLSSCQVACRTVSLQCLCHQWEAVALCEVCLDRIAACQLPQQRCSCACCRGTADLTAQHLHTQYALALLFSELLAICLSDASHLICHLKQAEQCSVQIS